MKASEHFNRGQYNRALNRLLLCWVTIQHPGFCLVREVVLPENIGILFILNQLRRKDLGDKIGRVFFTFSCGVRVHVGDTMFCASA